MLQFDKVSVFAKFAMGQVLGSSAAKEMLKILKSYGVPASKDLPREVVDDEEYAVWENEHIKVLFKDEEMSRYAGACIFALSDVGKRAVYEIISYFLKRGIIPDVRELKDHDRPFSSSLHGYVLRDGKMYRSKREFRKVSFHPESLISKDQFCEWLLRREFDGEYWSAGHDPSSQVSYSLDIPSRYEYEEVKEDEIVEVNVEVEVQGLEDGKYRWNDSERKESDCPWMEEFLFQNRPTQAWKREFKREQFLDMVEAVRNA